MSRGNAGSSAWAFKNFRLFTYGGLLLPFATQTQSLLIGWQIYEIKRDPLYLGFIGLAEALPALSLALISGYIVDRSNPRKVYIAMIWLNLLTALLLFAMSSPGVPLEGDQRVALLYLAAFMGGVARGFRMPTRTALTPYLVPREALHVSSAWNASVFAMASSVGPALGGFLYAWKGAAFAYGVNVLAVAAALYMTCLIRIEYSPSQSPPSSRALDELTAGLRYVFSHRLLLPALALDMFAVLFGGAVALLPVFAGEILHVGPSGLGVLRASASIGALVGSLLLIRFPVHRNSGVVLLASVAGFGVCMIGFGLSTHFWLSVGLLALGGAFDSVSMVVRGTIVQLVAPAEMKGRVGAVNSVFIGVSNQLGEFESGVAAKLFGTAPSVVLGGIFTLVTVGVIAVKAVELRRMEIAKL